MNANTDAAQLESFLLAINGPEREPAGQWQETQMVLADYLEDIGDKRASHVRTLKEEFPKQPTSLMADAIARGLNPGSVVNYKHLFMGFQLPGVWPSYQGKELLCVCPCSTPYDFAQENNPIAVWQAPGFVRCRQRVYELWIAHSGFPESLTFYIGQCDQCNSILWFAEPDEETREWMDSDTRERLILLFPEVKVNIARRRWYSWAMNEWSAFSLPSTSVSVTSQL